MNERLAHEALDEYAEFAVKHRNELRRISAQVIQLRPERQHELGQWFPAPGAITRHKAKPMHWAKRLAIVLGVIASTAFVLGYLYGTWHG